MENTHTRTPTPATRQTPRPSPAPPREVAFRQTGTIEFLQFPRIGFFHADSLGQLVRHHRFALAMLLVAPQFVEARPRDVGFEILVLSQARHAVVFEDLAGNTRQVKACVAPGTDATYEPMHPGAPGSGHTPPLSQSRNRRSGEGEGEVTHMKDMMVASLSSSPVGSRSWFKSMASNACALYDAMREEWRSGTNSVQMSDPGFQSGKHIVGG